MVEWSYLVAWRKRCHSVRLREGRKWGISRRQSLLVPVNKGCFNDNEAQLKSLIDRQANATSCFQLILYQVVKICKDLWQIWFSVSRYYRMACLQTVFLSWRDDAAFDFSNTFMTFMPKDQWNHYPGLFLTDWTRKAPSYWLLMMTVGESERNRNRGLRRLMMLEKMLWESSLVDIGTFSLESRASRGPFIEGLVARRKIGGCERVENWNCWFESWKSSKFGPCRQRAFSLVRAHFPSVYLFLRCYPATFESGIISSIWQSELEQQQHPHSWISADAVSLARTLNGKGWIHSCKLCAFGYHLAYLVRCCLRNWQEAATNIVCERNYCRLIKI